MHFACVGRWDCVEQSAEFPGQLFTEGSGTGGDDLAELDVGGAEVGEGLRDFLDDLLGNGALGGQFRQYAKTGPGELPAGDPDPGGL